MHLHNLQTLMIKGFAGVALIYLAVPIFAASWEQVDPNGVKAFKSGNLQAVKRILEKAEYFRDNQPLMNEALSFAVSSGNVELVKYLADRGWLEGCRKDPRQEGNKTCPLIPIAVTYGKVEMVKFLASQGFDLKTAMEEKYYEGRSLLHDAAGNGHLEMVRFLCESGIDATRRTESEYGSTALENAKDRVRGERDARSRANFAQVIDYLKDRDCKRPIAARVGCVSSLSSAAVVDGYGVNLREEPNPSARIVTTLNLGSYVNVLERKEKCETMAGGEGRWIRVHVSPSSTDAKHLEKEGWIFDSFVAYPGSFSRVSQWGGPRELRVCRANNDDSCEPFVLNADGTFVNARTKTKGRIFDYRDMLVLAYSENPPAEFAGAGVRIFMDRSGARCAHESLDEPSGMCRVALRYGHESGAIPKVAARVTQIAAGYRHTCARFHDGTVKCWGNNGVGVLGVGDTRPRGGAPGEMGATLPVVDLGRGRKATHITAGASHNCALLDDGAIKCWGYNVADGKNLGVKPDQMGDSLPAVDLGSRRRAVHVDTSAGFSFRTCAVLADGAVKCWGGNTGGELGLGDTQSRFRARDMGANLPAVDLGPGRKAVQVADGMYHTCALLDDGSVKCWGDNGQGQLGLESDRPRGRIQNEMGERLPVVDLGPERKSVHLRAGANHTCALLDDGSVKCWGGNKYGQLGLGDTRPRGKLPKDMGTELAAVDLGSGRKAVRIAAGHDHSCAVLDDGSVKCWGENYDGQLGLGDIWARGDQPDEMGDRLPAVNLGRKAVEVSAGAYYTCAVLDDGTVKCWGDNRFGQLGLGDRRNRGYVLSEMGESLPVVNLR